MPVDVVSRRTASSGSRLSSFGFSGTIAHGAFSAQRLETLDCLISPTPASLYRSRHHLSRAQHLERLSVARGVGSDPLSTLAGPPAMYCKVQTISRPASCKCVTQKTIHAHDHDEKSLPLNTINVTMGSWKHLLGMARNAPLDFLPQSNPNISYACAGDHLGIDAEVLRIVLAKAQRPVNMLQNGV